MNVLEKAINGQTITVWYDDIKDLFISLADLQAWCNSFELQYIATIVDGKTKYTISKP